ncbi:MAG: heparinase II/III family protein [Caldilineaceae bacterium]
MRDHRPRDRHHRHGGLHRRRPPRGREQSLYRRAQPAGCDVGVAAAATARRRRRFRGGCGVAVGRDAAHLPAAGWAAIRTHLDDPAQDLALVFRSSPYGAISHSHASNNDFFVHVAGKVMAMPSGYYDGYGSNHHTHWVWHTKSHNCVTLSGAPQIMRSYASVEAVEHAFDDDRLIYFRGNADASYADRATICRRHVIFLKRPQVFLLVDEFVTKPGIVSALQWNLHSWNQFEVDDEAHTFTIRRENSVLHGHFLYHHNAFFTVTEGWDPPPQSAKSNAQWYKQYNLRLTTSGLVDRRTLGVVLCPGHASLKPAAVRSERVDDVEFGYIDDIRVAVNQSTSMTIDGHQTDALIVLTLDGAHYAVTADGIAQTR